MARARKYGAYSGVVLEFINAIAADIAGDYPDIRVRVGAYTFYLDVPQGITPSANVMVGLAQLGSEWIGVVPRRDTSRRRAS